MRVGATDDDDDGSAEPRGQLAHATDDLALQALLVEVALTGQGRWEVAAGVVALDVRRAVGEIGLPQAERAGDALLGMRILDRGSREGTRKV